MEGWFTQERGECSIGGPREGVSYDGAGGGGPNGSLGGVMLGEKALGVGVL